MAQGFAETAQDFPVYPGDGADVLSTARDLAHWHQKVSALGTVMLSESFRVLPMPESTRPQHFIRNLDGSAGMMVAF